MRYHLGLAALILVGGIVAGWWFSRSAAAPTTPIGIRNSIAGADAVVATYSRTPNGPQSATTITFIDGKGWVWQQRSGAGSAGATVISTSSQALMAAAPGCYIAIPDDDAPAAPMVPGVSLVRDLSHAPQLKQDGAIYSYHISGDDGGGGLNVREDLGGIATTQSYRATVTSDGSGGTGLPGVYVVRRATEVEADLAKRLLSGAKASPVAAFTVRQRALVAGAPVQGGSIAMVSPEGCPDALSINPGSLGEMPSPQFFSMANPTQVLGVSASMRGNEIMLANAIAVGLPFDAPAEELLGALASGAPRPTAIKEGLTFGLPQGENGEPRALMSITGCKPEPWFAC